MSAPVIGKLLGPDGKVLQEVREDRPPCGFSPQPKPQREQKP